MNTNTITTTTTQTAIESTGSAIFFAIVPWLVVIILSIGILWALPKLQAYMMKIEPRVFDGMLITLLAGFIYSQAYFGADNAIDYVLPITLFWLKYGFGLCAAMMLALKGFRYGLTPGEKRDSNSVKLLDDPAQPSTTKTP